MDASNRECNIYHPHGYRTPYHKVFLSHNAQSTGIFFDLHSLYVLFENPFANSDDKAVIPHYIYLVAGLHNIGQFQADGAFYASPYYFIY